MKLQTVYNVITTPKIEESVSFYENIFNFAVIADIGWYKQLKHSETGIEIAFMEPNHQSQPTMYQPAWSGNGLILSFQFDDISSVYENIKSCGVKIAFERKEEEWGQIHFGIYDPNNIPIDIVQHTY